MAGIDDVNALDDVIELAEGRAVSSVYTRSSTYIVVYQLSVPVRRNFLRNKIIVISISKVISRYFMK
jgi:hypothetical protein